MITNLVLFQTPYLKSYKTIRRTNKCNDWFQNNNMIVNPDKFHKIFVRKDRLNTSGILMQIHQSTVLSEEWVQLLGVKIDNFHIIYAFQLQAF